MKIDINLKKEIIKILKKNSLRPFTVAEMAGLTKNKKEKVFETLEYIMAKESIYVYCQNDLNKNTEPKYIYVSEKDIEKMSK